MLTGMSRTPGTVRAAERTVRAALAAPFCPRALAALLYALLALPLALVALLLVVAGLVLGAALSWTSPGLWLLALTVRGALAAGDLQRVAARGLLGETGEWAQRLSRRRRTGPGPRGWRQALLTERAGWRAVGLVLLAPLAALPPVAAAVVGYAYGPLLLAHPLLQRWNHITEHRADGSERRVSLEVADVEFDTWPRLLVPVLLGALLVLLAPRLLRWALAPHRALLRASAGPSSAEQRIRTLEETRAQAVDDAAATLRRIERDLHDGTQARLVGLGMHLTLIRELIAAGAEKERLLSVVETASGNATAAVSDLRDLVKGIHPPVLDQGLETALATLVTAGPLPAELRCELPNRPAQAVESIAYFCVAELLANAAKHSAARHVAVDVHGDAHGAGGTLRLTVRDDGRGGAAVGAGSGLTGLLARVRTVDGTLECVSPPGGPTVITVNLPMG